MSGVWTSTWLSCIKHLDGARGNVSQLGGKHPCRLIKDVRYEELEEKKSENTSLSSFPTPPRTSTISSLGEHLKRHFNTLLSFTTSVRSASMLVTTNTGANSSRSTRLSLMMYQKHLRLVMTRVHLMSKTLTLRKERHSWPSMTSVLNTSARSKLTSGDFLSSYWTHLW